PQAGQLDLPEDVVAGQLDRQVLVVGDAAPGTAEPGPVVGGQRPDGGQDEGQGGESDGSLHAEPPGAERPMAVRGRKRPEPYAVNNDRKRVLLVGTLETGECFERPATARPATWRFSCQQPAGQLGRAHGFARLLHRARTTFLSITHSDTSGYEQSRRARSQ